MRFTLNEAIGFGLALLTATGFYADSGFEIVTYTVVGGAGVQESDDWSLFSAVGQPIVGGDAMGGGFSVTSGFPHTPGVLQCPGDLTDDGMLNFFDISAFLSAYSAQMPIADFNNDGMYNFFDISIFISLYSMGCP